MISQDFNFPEDFLQERRVGDYGRLRKIRWKIKRPARARRIYEISGLIISLLLFVPQALLANGDPKAGEIKSYTCTGCHGIPGYNNAYPTYNVPKIGGQNYEYLISALKSYRDGERAHPTMKLQASSLSEQDIQDISAYFASFGKDQ